MTLRLQPKLSPGGSAKVRRVCPAFYGLLLLAVISLFAGCATTPNPFVEAELELKQIAKEVKASCCKGEPQPEGSLGIPVITRSQARVVKAYLKRAYAINATAEFHFDSGGELDEFALEQVADLAQKARLALTEEVIYE